MDYLHFTCDVIWSDPLVLFAGNSENSHVIVSLPLPKPTFDTLRERLSEGKPVDGVLSHDILEKLRLGGLTSNKAPQSSYKAQIGYVPYKVSPGVWCIRHLSRLHCFRAAPDNTLPQLYRNIVSTWSVPELRAIAFELLSGKPIEVIARMFPMTLADVLEDAISDQEDEVAIYDIESESPGETRLQCHKLRTELLEGLGDLVNRVNLAKFSLLVPNIFSADAVGRGFVLSSEAVLAQHRCISIGDSPPYQVGRGISAQNAALVAVAESVERYCGQIGPLSVLEGRPSVAVPNAIPMQSFPIYSEHACEMDGIARFTSDLPLDWVSVEDPRGVCHMAPVDLIYYGVGPLRVHGSPRIFNTNSSGMAAHVADQLAKDIALREIIERDALMVLWRTRRPPPQIALKSLHSESAAIVDNISQHGYEVYVLDITLDLLPVCLVVARNCRQAYPYIACGASCAATLNRAAFKALQEVETHLWQSHGTKPLAAPLPSEVVSPADHAAFYNDPANGKFLEFLFEPAQNAGLSSTPLLFNEQTLLSEFVEQQGHAVFFRDVTSPEVSCLCKLRVYRALVTDLIPMTFGWRREVEVDSRLRNLKQKLHNQFDVTPACDIGVPHFFS